MWTVWTGLGVNVWTLQQNGPRGGMGQLLLALLPWIAIFVFFYILIILPTRRQQKKHQQLLASLKPGDRVVTSSGIYGTIVKVEDRTLKLRIADRVVVTIEKNAVTGLQQGETRS